MKLLAFQLDDQRRLRQIDADTWTRALDERPPRHLWLSIELEGNDPPIEPILDRLALSEAARDWTVRMPHSSPVRRHERSVLFVFPTSTVDPAPGEEPARLWFVCGPGVLVTIRSTPIPCLDELMHELLDEELPGTEPNPALVYQILDRLAEPTEDRAARARHWVRELWLHADEGRDGVAIADVLAAKREIDRLLSILEDSLHCLNGLLQEHSAAFLVERERERYRALADGVSHLQRSANRLETRLTHMQDNYELALHERTSKRLNVLTILQAIFVPLTLIAGIYGMNLEHIPGLQHPLAFPITIGAMGFVAMCTAAIFWRRGWFD